MRVRQCVISYWCWPLWLPAAWRMRNSRLPPRRKAQPQPRPFYPPPQFNLLKPQRHSQRLHSRAQPQPYSPQRLHNLSMLRHHSQRLHSRTPPQPYSLPNQPSLPGSLRRSQWLQSQAPPPKRLRHPAPTRCRTIARLTTPQTTASTSTPRTKIKPASRIGWRRKGFGSPEALRLQRPKPSLRWLHRLRRSSLHCPARRHLQVLQQPSPQRRLPSRPPAAGRQPRLRRFRASARTKASSTGC